MPRTEDLLRELAPQVLGTLARRSGDFDDAEDAVQEALIAAADHWPREGLPPNPRAWLLRTAGRRLIDHRRRENARMARELQRTLLESRSVDAQGEDDTLAVLFMCCHPALTPASAIALTLRAVGGLTTAEIARAFLVPEATMAQRITRAKRTIKASDVPFRLPAADELAVATRNVLRVLYLIFNEGYASSSSLELQRIGLSDEAIRLARLACELLPRDGEAAGLLALMLLIDARRPARMSPAGELISLADQDRTLWNREQLTEGLALLHRAMAMGQVGEYRLQAAIAAIHDRASRAEDTDWAQISALYELLERMTRNPLVTINRAVAVAMSDGPSAGLAVLDGVDDVLAGHHRLESVRAHLLEMAGDLDGALDGYRAAAGITPSLPEQRYLARRAAQVIARQRSAAT